MPDLGGDMIRVFTYNTETLALVELDPLVTDSGAGPRHGAFWTSPTSGEVFFFFGGELNQKVFTYKMAYKTEGVKLAWTKVSEIPALGVDGAKPNGTAPLSEVLLSVSPPSPPPRVQTDMPPSPTTRFSSSPAETSPSQPALNTPLDLQTQCPLSLLPMMALCP